MRAPIFLAFFLGFALGVLAEYLYDRKEPWEGDPIECIEQEVCPGWEELPAKPKKGVLRV